MALSTLWSSDLLALCPSGEPDTCCESPVPPSNGACVQGTRWSRFLSGVVSPNAKNFAVTRYHAVWSDYTGTTRRLYYATHSAVCTDTALSAVAITGTDGVETQDTSIKLNSSTSRVYFDRSGGNLNIEGREIPAQKVFSPLPATTTDRRAPGTTEGGALPAAVWEQGGDIWACLKLTCLAADIIQVTNTSDVERFPRISANLRAVWQNSTTGRVLYADLNQVPFSIVDVDSGFQPDINNDWIVYAKNEPKPDPGCNWATHSMIWAYGPFSGGPSAFRITSADYLGAANYNSPRLSSSYVVASVNYMYTTKTIVGFAKISDFNPNITNPPNAEFRELDEFANGYTTNIDLYEDTSTDYVFVVHRAQQIQSAALTCCRSGY
jgi:hypothetical protein